MENSLLMNILIYISASICIATTLILSCIIYRRDKKSYENQFFAFFFLGLGGLVVFYLFLQNPLLKEYSYPFQVLSMSLLIFSLFLFYYTIDHEGKLSMKVTLLSFITLFTLPLICLITHPYSFIEEWYGFEIIVEPWYMITICVLYMLFGFYAIIGLILMGLRTEDQFLRRKIEQNFLGLIVIGIGSILFLVIIPVFFNIHYLKPIGWLMITIGVIIMSYSFIGKRMNNDKTNENYMVHT